MTKIKLSQLLEYGKKEYSRIKLDKKIKEKILEKTIYRKSIFVNALKYSTVFTSFFIIVFFGYIFYNSIYEKQSGGLNNEKHISRTHLEKEENSNKTIEDKNSISLDNGNLNLAGPEKENSLYSAEPEKHVKKSTSYNRGGFSNSMTNSNFQINVSGAEAEAEESFWDKYSFIIIFGIGILFILIVFVIIKRKKK